MNVGFYKELHQAEFVRKKELDDSVNMPIGVITLIIGLLSYIVKSKKMLFGDCIILVLTFLILLLLFLAICFLIGTVNTFFIKYEYRYWGSAKEILKFENECNDYNKINTDDGINIDNQFKQKFAEYATYNKKVNDKRADNFILCKNCLIFSIFISVILLVYSFLK